MTAEVAIINREGVALAADSAVTIRGPNGQKILTSANKIFALSRVQPVGIMVYGAAGFLDVPWETLIKAFREELSSSAFPTLDGYSDAFFDFLRTKTARYFPAKAQRSHVVAVTGAYLASIRDDIDKRVETALGEKGSLTSTQARSIARRTIEEWCEVIADAHEVDGLPSGFHGAMKREYGALVLDGIQVMLGTHARSARTNRLLQDGLLQVFGKLVPAEEPPEQAGVVFAGFAEDSVLPGIREYHVEGMAANFMKLHKHLSDDIRHGATFAGIRPLAQSEMVVRFMEGVDPQYQLFVESLVEAVADEYPQAVLAGLTHLPPTVIDEIRTAFRDASGNLKENASDTLGQYRRQMYVDPVTALVDSLPKEDVAAMAESLVNLTSFKRRVSWDDETVGGPIDVAFISRGDGFVWIKRKHYFEAALNPQYFASKYGTTR